MSHLSGAVRIVRCELAKQFLSIDREVATLLLSISHLTGVPVVFPSLSMRNVLPPPTHTLQPHVLTNLAAQQTTSESQ